MVYSNAINLLPEVEQAEKNIRFIRSQGFVLSEVEGNTAQNRFLVKINDRLFYVGDLIYDILKQINSGSGLQSIAGSISAFLGKEATDETATIINAQITPMFTATVQQRRKAVKSLAHVLNPEHIHFLIKPLSKLYTPYVFPILMAFGVLFNVLFLLAIKLSWIPNGVVVPLDIPHYALYFSCILGFIIFHEIGHAAAAAQYGIIPRKIGFGIYFLFPAFYTDLTDIWALPARSRIVINLGGIYMQLLVNVLLFFIMLSLDPAGEAYYFIHRFMLFNIFISLYNINPFFRFDGYWVYSDYFHLPNLRQRSMKLIGQTWMRLTGRRIQASEKPTAALWVYSILYFMFMSFIWFVILRIVFNAHLKAMLIVPNLHHFDYTRGSDWKLAAVPLFIVILFWSLVGYKIVRKYKRKYHANR
ncbi:MAG: hypothetical protein HUU01_20460 [Saprospiraceae bacterium]|nr:hypothetical protein [Saprospiraceae bacterium]